MKTQLEMVKTFLLTQKMLAPGVGPRAFSLKQAIDRHHLMTEELSEYLQAASEKDGPEILDALVDLQYLLLGTVSLYGLQDVFEEAFYRVHQANMQKEPGVNSGRKLLSTDVVKPLGWRPANLEDLVTCL